MAKKHPKSMKMESDVAEVCEDCGNEECQCGPCDGCGQMECSGEGGACGGNCGSGCGGGGCCSGYGGYGMGMHKKFLGIGLVALGVLWYAKNMGYLNPALFWPVVFILAGVALMAKSMWMKHHMHG